MQISSGMWSVCVFCQDFKMADPQPCLSSVGVSKPILTCVFPDLGGYLSLMAGIQLAWHRLEKERTSKTPNTQPHTPSSSSRTKLYSGHSARHGPRHLHPGKYKSMIKGFAFKLNSLKHTPVSYDVGVRGAGLVTTLSPQVELAYHPIQLHLEAHTKWCISRILLSV